ncbi:MAG: bifunctional demethylmenaquinone methyltransferase/2-methoxy-6-polyprenyl-1,4-benzoquinol methylase UbiE [Hyphomicrobiaceae bacterium]
MTSAHTPEPPSGGDTVSFGFKVVPEGARQGLVNEVFTTVAGRYDLMNDLMSGGLHRLWKDDLIGTLAPPRSDRPFHLLDVAGGTGDITLKALRAGGAGSSVTLLDINPEMVEVGAKRVADAGLSDRVTFVIGNAETLPFPDKTFDAYTIAFGIRNVTHIDKALAEAWRVLKTGGRFLALEFSACEVPLLDRLYELHSFEIIPRLATLAAGDAEPYRYLVESIRKFPKQARFAEMIRAAGFSRVSFRNLTGGIAAIHSGWRT